MANFINDLLKSLISPERYAAGGLIQAPVAAATQGKVNTYDIPVIGGLLGLSNDELKKMGDINAPLADRATKTGVKYGKEALKAASYTVPFGKGTDILTKYLFPGAVVGGLQSASEDNANIGSVFGGATSGALTAGALGKGTELLGGILSKGGQKLTKTGEDLAIRAIRPSKSQLYNFTKDAGESMPEFLKKRNLIGADYTKIADYTDKLQSQFDEIANSSNLMINPQELLTGFSDEIDKLLKSGVKTNKSIARQVQEQALETLSKFGDGQISASDLTNHRRDIDALIKNFSTDPRTKGYLQVTRDVLQNAIRNAADKAGINVNGLGLKGLGTELSKAYKLLDVAEKQQFLGKGTLPAGLTQLLGGGIGGGLGGVPGAFVGVAAANTLNSPKVIGGLAQGAIKAGEGIQGAALPNVLQQILGQTSSRIPSVVTQMAQQNSQPNNEKNANQSENMSQNINPPAPSIPQTPKQSNGLLTRDQIAQLMVTDLGLTGGKNLDKLKILNDLITPQESTLQLSDSAIKVSTDLSSGIREVGELTTSIKNSDKVGPIRGLESFNPYDTKAKSLQAQIDSVRQTVGRALEGGVLRKEDEEKYKKILPLITDTKEVALSKLRLLKQKLQSDLENYVQTQQASGKGRNQPNTDVLSILGLQ